MLDELSLLAVAACGVNMPCPDLLTPQRAAAAIWSWAPGHPYSAAAAHVPFSVWQHALRWLLLALPWHPYTPQVIFCQSLFSLVSFLRQLMIWSLCAV